MILLLASQSPARLATLRAAGIDPLVAVSGVDEDAALAFARERFGEMAPEDIPLVLAQAKAEAVTRSFEDDDAENPTQDYPDFVLGCDSVFELDGEVHGKPHDAEHAIERLHAMSGRAGSLHTGHWLIDLRGSHEGGTGATLGATSTTIVKIATMSDDEIKAYVATGEPLAVAGSFTIDGLGGPFIEGIEGDHHGVVGLSLPLLRELLSEIGVSIPQLWRDSLR